MPCPHGKHVNACPICLGVAYALDKWASWREEHDLRDKVLGVPYPRALDLKPRQPRSEPNVENPFEVLDRVPVRLTRDDREFLISLHIKG